MFSLIVICIIIWFVLAYKQIPPKSKGIVRDLQGNLVRTIDGGPAGRTIFINPLKETLVLDKVGANTSSFNFMVTTSDKRNYMAALNIQYTVSGFTDMTGNQIIGILKSDVTKYTKRYIAEIPDSALRVRIYEVPNKIVREVNSRLVKYNFRLTNVKLALNKAGSATLNNDASRDGISDNYVTDKGKPDCIHEDPGYVSKAQKYKKSGAIQYDNFIDKDDDGITVFGFDNSNNPIRETPSVTSKLKNTIETDYYNANDDPIKNL